MNRIFFIGITICMILSSCGQEKETTYKAYTSPDGCYSIEVPTFAIKGKSVADFMNFADEKSNLIISIRDARGDRMDEDIEKRRVADDSFTYTSFQSSDSTSFYKITRGNNMWSFYDLYMLKILDGKKYIIQVGSDIIEKKELINIAKHIYSSMKKCSKAVETSTAKSEKAKPSLSLLYSNKYYSIKYPKGWKKIEHLDEMTEVYIGSETESFGFTIVRFETDYTLAEINKEGNENIKQAGFKIIEGKMITLCGQKCYRAIHGVKVQNQKTRHISYTFKKGDMLYNIKFGSVNTKAQEELVDEIIETFNFK